MSRAASALTFWLSLACAAQGSGDEEPSKRMPRLFVYTVSAGYEHEVARRASGDELSLVERAVVDLGRKSGAFEAECSRDSADFTPAKLANFDLVLFYTSGELPLSKAEREALFAFVREGKGFAGVHCAADTLYQAPEYGAMLGAYFDGHPWHENVTIRVEDREHPAMRHLGSSFQISDEIYQFKAPYDRAKLHVLASLDTRGIDLARDGVRRADKDFAIAWTREYGRGRVFYTALGHRPEVWRDERFLAHLAGGLRWAMRQEDSAGPPEEPPKQERPRASEAGGELAAYRARALASRGDPARGHALFREVSRAMCIRCHTVYGKGTPVGPELSDVAAKHTLEEIVTSVLEPSQWIADGYVTTTFELAGGQILSGQIRREAQGAIEVYDTNGEVRTIRVGEVVTRRTSSTSLMPAGLANLLTEAEFADLIAYLATLRGAPGTPRAPVPPIPREASGR